MWADTCMAVKEAEQRQPFTYIVFTSESNLPGWLPSECVSGRDFLEDEFGFEEREGPQSRLVKFGRELEKSSPTKKFFKSLSHWQVVYDRVMLGAICCDQWDWACHYAYRDKIAHLCETESHKYGKIGVAIGLLYDELERNSFSTRTRRFDSQLTCMKELCAACGKVDEHLLAQSRTRVQYVLQRGGAELAAQYGIGCSSGPSGSRDDYYAEEPPLADQWSPSLGSLVTKSGAAMAAVSKNTSKFMADLAGHQEDLRKKRQAMESPDVGSPGGGNAKDRKHAKWVQKLIDKKDGNGGGWSGKDVGLTPWWETSIPWKGGAARGKGKGKGGKGKGGKGGRKRHDRGGIS